MTHTEQRRRAAPMALLGLALLLVTMTWPAPATGSGRDSYYGFVVYAFDENASDGEPLDAFPLIKSLGAGWVQGEAGGIGVATQAIVWGDVVPYDGVGEPPDLADPANYRYGTLSWIDEALAQGLGVVASIETGRSGWTANATCGIAPNCVPKDWSRWYQFVYQVVLHFREKGVTHFKSTEEACLDWNYFGGSKEDMYGNGSEVRIRGARGRRKVVMKGIVPVAHLATHDANREAVFAVGAAAGGGPYIALDHLYGLYRRWTRDRPAREWPGLWDKVRARARRSYNIDLSGFTAEQVRSNRCRQFVAQSLKYPRTFDAYGMHLYDVFGDSFGFMTSEGFSRSMFYARSQLPLDKPLWVTGTGILSGNVPSWNPYQEDTPRRIAHHLLRTLVGAYASGVEWLTYTSLGNAATGCNPPERCDSALYGYHNYPYRNEAADTFSMMATIFPTRDSFAYECTIQGDAPSGSFGACRSGWHGGFKAGANVVMHRFRRFATDDPLRTVGHVAAGWCLDLDPGLKGEPWRFDNAGCPTTVDLGQLAARLGIADGDHAAIFSYKGDLVGSGAFATGSPLSVAFDEAPFLIVWGEDGDQDGVPDVADNCPLTPNPDQVDDFPPGGEILVGHDNPAIDAPDGVGYVCDSLPSISNRDQGTRSGR